MKKKLLTMFMALITVFALAACGGGEAAEPTTVPEPTGAESTKPSTGEPADPTEAPVPVPAERTVYDISDWQFYYGIVEQIGDFESIVYTQAKDFSKAGFMFLNGDGTVGGYFFGRIDLDAETMMYSITDEATGEVACFKMATVMEYYELGLGGLGYLYVAQIDAATGQQYLDLTKNVATNITSEFLAELEKIKEGVGDEGYYCGVMDTGDQVYYSRVQNGANNGLLIISEDRRNVVVVQGNATYDETTQTESIFDYSTGHTVFYRLKQSGDGYELCFADGEMGTVTVTRCNEYEFLDAVDYACMEAENNITEEFVERLKDSYR
ncbi:MAG: hypothetical protein ACI4FZ_13325 [Lachnospiraceae bacterium]